MNTTDMIRHLALQWRDSPERPRVDSNVLVYWEALVNNLAENSQMPLLVRKGGRDVKNNVVSRGRLYMHSLSGRPLVHVDNSPANWCLSAAFQGESPTVDQIISGLEIGSFPIAMMLKADERQSATYRGTLKTKMNPPNLNTTGWKVCHIESIGLKDKKPATELPLELLKAHMKLLLNPRNMFVVPKDLGLGENPDYIAVFRELLDIRVGGK